MRITLIALLYCAGWLQAAFESGGVSIDFSLYGPKKVQPAGENLLAHGSFEGAEVTLSGGSGPGQWRGHAHVHGATNVPELASFRQEVLTKSQRRIVSENPAAGQNCAAILTPETLRELFKPLPMISNKISQFVAITPSEQASKYRLSFQTRGRHYQAPILSTLSVFVAMDKKSPETGRYAQTKKTAQHRFTLDNEWQTHSIELLVPPGSERLDFTFALYGLGECYLDEIALVAQELSSGIEVRLHPAQELDQLYALGEGLPGSLNFTFQCEGELQRKALQLLVALPPGFTLVDQRDLNPLLDSTTLPDGGTLCRFNLQRFPKVAFKDYYLHHAAAILVKSSHTASDRLYPAQYWLEDGDWQGTKKNFNFRIISAVQAERPKRFRSAAMVGHEFTYIADGAGNQAFADFYLSTGMSCIHGAPAQVSKILQAAGISRYKGHYYLANGFRIGPPNHTEEAKFRMVDGSPYPRKICPVEVYKRGEYYRSQVEPMLEKELVTDDITDNYMSNWEPYYLDGKGCFCERCREEFVAFMPQEDPARIRSSWPQNTIKEYGEKWMKFRSWQHGQLVITLEKSINSLGQKLGKDSHFLPEISWNSMMKHGNAYCKQYNVLDYMHDLPWIEPWGPYFFYRYSQAYKYYPANHLVTYLAAGQMKDFARENTAAGQNLPKLIAFPHGVQGNDWVTEPEAIANEVLSFFLQGWEGAFSYYFPRGYDYRYWREWAKANTIIARHEDFVYDGQQIDSQVEVQPLTPMLENLYYPPVWAEGEGFVGKVPGLHKQGVMQTKAFRLQDRYLVAVGNFWQRGEIFFRLKVKDLPGEVRYTVTTPAADCGTFTAAELSEGIRLQVGALRWLFVTLSPADPNRAAGLPKVSQQDLQRLQAERLPLIQAACQDEKARYERYMALEAAESPVNDFKSIKPLENAGVSLQVDAELLQISTAKYQLSVDAGTAGRITNWRSDGVELTTADPKFGLGVNAFWWPKDGAVILISGYLIKEVKKVDEGLAVVLCRKLTPRDNAYLAGLELTVTQTFTRDGVIVNTVIQNTLDDALSFSFRFHNLLAFFQVKDKIAGKATFADGAVFTRDFFEKLFQFAEPDNDLEKAFRMDKVFKTTSNTMTVTAPWTKLQLTAEVPADKLQCYVFWDSVKQDTSSFEPIFKKTILPPGGTVEYYTRWTLK
jgi:hypothetical protein